MLPQLIILKTLNIGLLSLRLNTPSGFKKFGCSWGVACLNFVHSGLAKYLYKTSFLIRTDTCGKCGKWGGVRYK